MVGERNMERVCRSLHSGSLRSEFAQRVCSLFARPDVGTVLEGGCMAGDIDDDGYDAADYNDESD